MRSDRCRELDEGLRDPARNLQAKGEWLQGLTAVEDCIAAGLRRASEGEDWLMFDRYVLAALYHPSRAYTEVLCQVLRRRLSEVTNENIVDVLDKTRDPAAVDCLRDALLWEPEWDEYRNLAVKCVWALAAIGTESALAALREAAQSEDETVSEAARHELKQVRR